MIAASTEANASLSSLVSSFVVFSVIVPKWYGSILSQYTLLGIWVNKNKSRKGKKNILPPLNSKKFFFVCRRPLPAVYWGRLCLRSLRLYVLSVFRKPEFAQSADIMCFTLGLALRQAVAAWRVVMVVQLKFGLSEKHTKFEKIFLMVLTNQLIYLVNVKTIDHFDHFSNYVCFSKSPNFFFWNEMMTTLRTSSLFLINNLF